MWTSPSPSKVVHEAIQDHRLKVLVLEAVGGSSCAFNELYRLSIRALFPSVQYFCGVHTEDVLAETYLQAWKTLTTFDADRCTVVGWLVTIARSRAQDRLRRERIRHGGMDGAVQFEPDNEASEDVGPEEQVSFSQQREWLYSAVATLHPTQRWVMSLAYYRDYSHLEISALTGIPLGTIKTLIQRSKNQLRGMMTGETALLPSNHVAATST